MDPRDVMFWHRQPAATICVPQCVSHFSATGLSGCVFVYAQRATNIGSMVRDARLLSKVAISCVNGTPHTQAEDTSDQPKASV